MKHQFDDATLAAVQQMSKTQLTRALAILTTEVDESEIAFQGYDVIVRGQHFDPRVPEDRAILAILMADKEFGFACSAVEVIAKELRALQKVWFDAADELGLNDARRARIEQRLEAAQKVAA